MPKEQLKTHLNKLSDNSNLNDIKESLKYDY